MHRIVLFLLVPLLHFAFVNLAWAQGDPKDPSAALFKEGRAAMDAKDFTTAKQKLEASYRLKPATGTLLNIAICEDSLGDAKAALTHFREVKGKLAPDDERMALVNERITVIESRMPRLTITLAVGAPANTRITRDDALLAAASLGRAEVLEPGPHAIVVSADGRADKRYDLVLAAGETKTLVVEPGPPGAGTAPKRVEVQAPPSGLGVRTIAGIVVGSVGVLSLGAGIATGVMTLQRKSTVEDDCHGTSVCDTQEGIDASAEGATLSIVSTVTFVVGLAAIGGGVVLIATDKRGEAPAATAAMAPYFSPTSAGIGVVGSF